MRKLSLIFFVSLLAITSVLAQTKLKGTVKIAGTENPLKGAKVTLLQQSISSLTNQSGEFSLSYINDGSEEVSISCPGYFTQIKLVNIVKDQETDMGVVYLVVDAHAELQQEVVMQLSENQLDDDDAKSNNISGSTSAQNDVYNSQTSYNFSAMRFRTRGYDNKYETTYINGVMFNGLERGNFNYSALGGLNDAMRNQEEILGLNANSFSYGNLGSVTNINTRATSYAAGSKASVAFSNRSYKVRGQYTYATGLQSNGWAFAVSAVARWADEGIVDGTFYRSAGLFLSAEKVFNTKHSLSLVAYGTPTQRAQQGAVTQEVYDLAGSIYYNPYWGYQDGKVRNSRIVKSFDPTVILSHDFKIDELQRLCTGIAYHYSMYSNSALTFYNAPDPRPDYYRYLPSYQTNESLQNQITDMWLSNDYSVSQVNWDALYQANYRNNVNNPNGSAKYSVERRHNNLAELAFNSTYTNQLNKSLKLTAGIMAKTSKGMHYKTMDDLLGGNQWIDIDQFAERDFPSDPNIIQNDLNNPNRVIQVGDIFGYNYDIHVHNMSAFVQNEWVLPQFDIYYAANVGYTDFYRYGRMLNGRAEAQGEQSYGKGKTWYTTNPSVKGGITYKIDGRNKLYVNATAETRAPDVSNSYVSVRIKDTAVPMQDELIYSEDINYAFIYPNFRGRISAFHTDISKSSDLYGYYDDENQTYVNFMLSDMSKVYQGIEAGLSFKINKSFSVSMAGTYADYHYTSKTATGIKSAENGSFDDVKEDVLLTDYNGNSLKIASGPQLAANVTLDYFHPKMWFADVTLNYFDNNYLDFAPNRFLESNIALYTTDKMKATFQSQEKLQGGFILNASVGKLIYLKNRKSVNINLSAGNILNNTSMITGGYSQARLPLNDGAIDVTGLNRFPNKYYYAWGFNMFLNIGYKF
ncbi:MAG: carboxypeptidase-like regulatory domain-containing protein [Paludibacter sp.]|nr:carboxypeptidase-like regulatory domain-containing protein [Paludibacter sp.]